jgi:hypothetical protein
MVIKMKLMIASDIHGSSYYCQKMLTAFQQERADRLLLLGDILYHGPRNDLPKDYDPKKVIALLNPLADQLLCVRGNCDSEVDQMVLQFPILADYAILSLSEHMIFATHGHLYHSENLPPLHAGDILLQGHTHIPTCQEKNGIFCLNPGSVSIPKENSSHSYMVLEENTFLWKNLDGEIENRFSLS